MYFFHGAGRALWFVLLLPLALSIIGCRKQAVSATSRADAPIPVHFTEVAREAGIDFTHVNGARGRKLMPETVGSGVAFLDYDNDGKLDLLIMNGRTWLGDPNPIASTPRLYRNLGGGRFRDVTKEVGLDISLYGMGVAVGDYDNDGYPDLYLTAVGPNYLFRNDGGRRFVDVTAQAGVVGVPLPGTKMEHKWSSSAAWLDYDKDGRLDLFVCQYVKWSPEIDPFCGRNGIRGYCPPDSFEGARCTLFRNEGGGRFRDVSEEVGLLNGPPGKSFGIGIADFNGDGWPDIAIANDTWANFLFINENGKRFVDKAIQSGIAYGEGGKARAGMGIDVADYRNDGNFGIVIGNFANEGLALFEPWSEEMLFNDQAQFRRLTAPSLLSVTFATFFFDYDLDGWQDLFAANGHVDDIVNTYESNLTFRQKPLLFHNRRGDHFEPVNDPGLNRQIVGRGAAFGDMDGDGDLDIAVVDNGGRFLLFRNDGGNSNRWIRLHAQGTRSNRDGIGALVRVSAGGNTQSQYVRSGGSFLSESERTLTFGLGKTETVDSVEVHWPSGRVDRAQKLPAGRTYRMIEGEGFTPLPP